MTQNLRHAFSWQGEREVYTVTGAELFVTCLFYARQYTRCFILIMAYNLHKDAYEIGLFPFADEKTVAERSNIACSKSHS